MLDETVASPYPAIVCIKSYFKGEFGSWLAARTLMNAEYRTRLNSCMHNKNKYFKDVECGGTRKREGIVLGCLGRSNLESLHNLLLHYGQSYRLPSCWWADPNKG